MCRTAETETHLRDLEGNIERREERYISTRRHSAGDSGTKEMKGCVSHMTTKNHKQPPRGLNNKYK